MKAARLKAYGDPDQFESGDVPDPVPGPNEVLVRVKSSGLNPVDLFVRQGFMAKYAPLELPAIIGVDAAGTIAALGAGVSGFAVGDRVIAHLPLNGRGAHAELARVPLAGLAGLPDSVSFEQGATLPLIGLSGRNAVDALGVKRGDRVLVSGALGGVGRAAVQYLSELGAVPVAGVRRERLAEGRALAGEAVDIAGPPASPAFDFAISAAPSVAGSVFAFVRDGGTIATLVQTPEGANENGRVKVVQASGADNPAMLQAVADAAGRGDLRVPIAATFALSELADAHRTLAAGPHGKVVIRH